MQHRSRPFIRLFTVMFSMTVAFFIASCTDEASPEQIEDRGRADSVTKAEEREKLHRDSIMSRFPRITYHRLPVSSANILDSVRRTFAKTKETWKNYRVLTLLNRKDIHHVRLNDTLVLPDSIFEDLRAYSVFPQYWPEGDTISKAILISNMWQSYACYKNGELVRYAACNAGEERKPTLPGRYAVNWRDRKRISSLDSTWILPFTVNFHLHAGSAFHQFDMPGRPVSHSCVRQFLSDAEWLYRWVKTARVDTIKHQFIPWSGTPVVILDVFDFSRRRGGPWLEITSNQDASVALPKDLYAIDEALIPLSQIPREVRGSLRNKARYVTADSILRATGVIRPGVSLRESIDFNKLRQAKELRKLEAAKKAHPKTTPSTDGAN